MVSGPPIANAVPIKMYDSDLVIAVKRLIKEILRQFYMFYFQVFKFNEKVPVQLVFKFDVGGDHVLPYLVHKKHFSTKLTRQQMKFFIKDLLFVIIEEFLNGELHFCAVDFPYPYPFYVTQMRLCVDQ